MAREDHNETINMNPRINSLDKTDFERGIHKACADGYDLNKSTMFRQLAYKFIENPDETLEWLGINKK